MKRALALAAALIALVGQSPPGDGPSVIIYPFTASADIDPTAGGKLAFFIAARLAQTGGVGVKDTPPAIARTAYLDAARKAGADYYVAGYVTPLGNEATLVVQLVSTTSGISVWSNTSEVRTYSDASATADLIHTAMLLHFVHQLPTYSVRSPSPGASTAASKATAAPAAVASQAPVPVIATQPPAARTAARLTPVPAATIAPAIAVASPSPAPQVPAVVSARSLVGPGVVNQPYNGLPPRLTGPVIVVIAGGSAVDSDRAEAARSLTDSLKGSGIDATFDDASSANDLPAQLTSLCAEYRVPSILTGSLTNSRSQADFELQRYECASGTLSTADGSARGGGRGAIRAAVNAAVANYLKLLPPATGPTARPAS